MNGRDVLIKVQVRGGFVLAPAGGYGQNQDTSAPGWFRGGPAKKLHVLHPDRRSELYGENKTGKYPPLAKGLEKVRGDCGNGSSPKKRATGEKSRRFTVNCKRCPWEKNTPMLCPERKGSPGYGGGKSRSKTHQGEGSKFSSRRESFPKKNIEPIHRGAKTEKPNYMPLLGPPVQRGDPRGNRHLPKNFLYEKEDFSR